MIKKASIKVIIVITLLISVVWFWQTNTPNNSPTETSISGLLSAVSDANAESTDNNIVQTSGLYKADNQLDGALGLRLDKAIGLMEKNQTDQAISEFKSIIEIKPQAIEPYINLASLYAKKQKIELAKTTLHDAIQANKNTAVMFDSLQKIYAAQAALAYQRALTIDTVDDDSLTVTLPTVRSLALAENNDRTLNLERQVVKLNESLELTASKERTLTDKIQLLQDENRALELTNSDFLSREKNDVNNEEALRQNEVTLQKELDLAKKSYAQSKNAHRDEITKLKQEFSDNVDALNKKFEFELAAAKKSNVIVAQEVAQTTNSEALSNGEALPSVIVVDSNVVETNQIQKNKSIAISLVKRWAKQWSEQNVTAYIERYTDDFRPSSGLSNKRWREQRQVRLTNKSFIEVDVSQFLVEGKGSKFSVTFYQHYKSNNVDDKIKKKLTFITRSNDWSIAKIASEAIIPQ